MKAEDKRAAIVARLMREIGPSAAQVVVGMINQYPTRNVPYVAIPDKVRALGGVVLHPDHDAIRDYLKVKAGVYRALVKKACRAGYIKRGPTVEHGGIAEPVYILHLEVLDALCPGGVDAE